MRDAVRFFDYQIRRLSAKGWRIEDFQIKEFAAPGDTIKRFATVIATRLH